MSLLRRLFGTRSPPPSPPPARVAIRAGSVVTEIGPAAILHGLFSTIAANLEPGGWGSRFPITMHRLYRGELLPGDCRQALQELRTIDAALTQRPVSSVVWDADDPARPPSPHYRLGDGAANAAEFFVTVNGLNLLRAGLIESVESAVEFGHPVHIVAFGSHAALFAGRT